MILIIILISILQVLSLDISEFSPDAEDSRSSMLLAQMFYQFSLGVTSRPASVHSAAKALGRAVPPAVSVEGTHTEHAGGSQVGVNASAGGAGGGAGSFMYGEDATAMRVPFRLTVHDRSSEQVQFNVAIFVYLSVSARCNPLSLNSLRSLGSVYILAHIHVTLTHFPLVFSVIFTRAAAPP